MLLQDKDLKVSIITPSYNSAGTIQNTLESVRNQTYKNIEHIIVDGVSSDKTLEIVEQFPHIFKIISEPDNGIYDAMNKGIQLATGDWIGILNADDFYTYNSVISEVVQLIENRKEIEGVYADLEFVASENTVRVIRRWKSGYYKEGDFFYGWMPPHPTFFVKRELYEKYGLFNLRLGTAADYELMLRFIHKNNCKMAYLPKTIIKMRIGGASSESIMARLKANRKDKMAWEVNSLKPRFYTLILKPLRKLLQYSLFNYSSK